MGKERAFKEVEITHGGLRLSARVYSFAIGEEPESFVEKKRQEVLAAGGAIFHHTKKPPLQPVETPAGSAYRYSTPPVPQVWHVLHTTFEDLLTASRFFGFPHKDRVKDPDRVFERVRALLIETHRRSRLRFSQIEDSHLLLELAQPESRLESAEAAGILAFNATWFRVRYSAGEERDYKSNWVKKRFFTVGEI